MRFRQHRRTVLYELESAPQKRRQCEQEFEKQRQLFGLIMRLARRPWLVTERFQQLATVQTIENFSLRKLKRLFYVGDLLLTKAPRDSFLTNVRLILSFSAKAAVIDMTLKNPLFTIETIKLCRVRFLKQW